MVRYAYDNVAFYRKSFDEKGIRPDDIKTLDDLPKLPFTTKADLRDHYPFGFCAVPVDRIIRMHASSGTTGAPTPVFHTRKDLAVWTDLMARNQTMAGVREDDVCQMAFKYTLFTGAFGHHAGAERIGAMVIPASSGQTERHVMLMRDFNSTVLLCTPSYALTIAEVMTAMGVDKSDLSLRLGIHGAEAMSEEMRYEIEASLGITAIRDYGFTEIGGPGVSIECAEQAGYHINEDFFLPEIVDPDTLEPLPAGHTGELVFTALQKEAMPLIRYRTRDVTHLNPDPCACGRTLVRHGPILGRTDDMLIVGGVNFFPSQLEGVVLGFEEIQPQYDIHLSRYRGRDRVTVHVETTSGFWAKSGEEGLDDLAKRMEKKIKDWIGFRIEVHLVEPFTLPRSEGKAHRVHDQR
jgi:phenylacetate-CoA ligase